MLDGDKFVNQTIWNSQPGPPREASAMRLARPASAPQLRSSTLPQASRNSEGSPMSKRVKGIDMCVQLWPFTSYNWL